MAKNYNSQIKKFKKGKQIGPVNVDDFQQAYKEKQAETREGSKNAFRAKMKRTTSTGYMPKRRPSNQIEAKGMM